MRVNATLPAAVCFLLTAVGCDPAFGRHRDGAEGTRPLGKGDTIATEFAPWHGSQRAVVVLLEWSNVDAVVTAEQVDAAFFAEGRSTASVRQFFLENSRGRFDLSGDVLDWRRAAQSWDPDADCAVDDVAATAWATFGSDIDVAEYDADDNGRIDNLFVVHSARIGSDRVGPDCMFATHPIADHAIVFQSQGVGSIGEAIPIGFYIHEGGHQHYWLPDLYRNHYHGEYGIGMWGMMGLGAWGTNNLIPRAELFAVPAHFEPYSKVLIGWVEPRVIDVSRYGVSVRPVEASGDILVVPIGDGINYYLEYRSPRGFSADQRGHGLLIWKNYDLVQADGRDDLNHGTDLGYRPLPPIDENFGDATDPFPGDDMVSAYADPDAGISFENIRRFDNRVELDIVIEPGPRPFILDPDRERFDGVERL